MLARVYILTNRLVELTGAALPLPWYHRAPLGLVSGTPLHVALQAPKHRPFGDLIVSVADPVNWPFVSEIRTSRADEPGVLADAYGLAPPLNIVFAEAVTIDSGSRQDARLVLEPFHPRPDESDVTGMVDTQVDRIMDHLIERGFSDSTHRRIHPAHTDFTWMDVGRIEFGWVEVEGWREAVTAQGGDAADADEYDLTMAVVSADTQRRILRYVFPRKGAASVSVAHADRPGALAQIAGVLGASKLNILSSLLRRGSAPAYKAEFVAVVEPTQERLAFEDVELSVRDALKTLPKSLRVRAEVLGAVDPENAVLYPRRPHEIAVRPGATLEAAIRAVRGEIPEGRRPIFVSRRFVDAFDEYNRSVVEELRNVLNDHGFHAVEATPQPGAETVTSDEVKAKMWASEAAIVLVVSTPDERAFSENLAHEWGFMQGQGKPLLPLVQAGVAASVTVNANLQGLQLSTFSETAATNRHQPNSIYRQVHDWLNVLYGKRR